MTQIGRVKNTVFSGGSRTTATSKMELFVVIVNGFQPLTIITKCSILDVAAVLFRLWFFSSGVMFHQSRNHN